MIRHVIDNHNEPIPAVLEIPSKDHPYDASKDSILRRAKVIAIVFFIYFFFKLAKPFSFIE
jgi:ATP synthase F subunit